VTATRIAHLRANAACSAVYMEADRIAVVANGTVEWCRWRYDVIASQAAPSR
jgi:hypothetical protein